jgi:hypothetical protein
MVQNWIRNLIRAGEGTQLKIIPSMLGVLSGYLRILKPRLSFSAFLEVNEAQVRAADGKTFAVDSVGHPIAIEFAAGEGRLCFVPVPSAAPPGQVGAAVLQAIEWHFGGPTDIPAPTWVDDIEVPSASAHDAEIADLEIKNEELTRKISDLVQERNKLLNYRNLLFGTGKAVLEPIVRQALTLLGFAVPEPSTYKGEWDVELRDPLGGGTAICEVEGAEGVVDYDKFRQLLTYIQDELLEGREQKGLLIGNGHRLKDLNAVERQSQFSEHAMRAAARFGICMLPTTELFRAVCAVLAAPGDNALKIKIRESILTAVGTWNFVPGADNENPTPACAGPART